MVAKKSGYLWIKLSANSAGVGMPDRLLVSTSGEIVWCELKTLRGQLSTAQKHTHADLRRHGQRVEVIRDPDTMQVLVDSLNRA